MGRTRVGRLGIRPETSPGKPEEPMTEPAKDPTPSILQEHKAELQGALPEGTPVVILIMPRGHQPVHLASAATLEQLNTMSQFLAVEARKATIKAELATLEGL